MTCFKCSISALRLRPRFGITLEMFTITISTTSLKLGKWILWNCVECLQFFKCYRNISSSSRFFLICLFLLTQAVHLSQWIPWPCMHISLAELPTAPHPLDHHQPWKLRHHLLALPYPVPHLYHQRQMVNICSIKLALTAQKPTFGDVLLQI